MSAFFSGEATEELQEVFESLYYGHCDLVCTNVDKWAVDFTEVIYYFSQKALKADLNFHLKVREVMSVAEDYAHVVAFDDEYAAAREKVSIDGYCVPLKICTFKGLQECQCWDDDFLREVVLDPPRSFETLITIVLTKVMLNNVCAVPRRSSRSSSRSRSPRR